MHMHIDFFLFFSNAYAYAYSYDILNDMSIDINDLLKKAMVAKRGGHIPWYEKIPAEAVPFTNGIEQMVQEGKKPVASSVHRILTEEFNIDVSRSRVAEWLKTLHNE